MFIDVSRRRSPSTVNLPICSRSLSISASVRSLIFADWRTPAASQMERARARTTRLRRTILHLRQIFLTEACTRIFLSLLRAEGDPRLGQIVGREFHGDLVAGEDADVVH